MLADIRYAMRCFRRSSAFALMAIFSLAMGIGANTAIFSLVNAVLLRTLPVRDPNRLVMLSLSQPDRFGGSPIPRQLYRQISDRNSVLEGFAGITFPPITVSGDGNAERVSGLLVSGNFFQTLGVSALLGRVVTPEDDRIPDSPSVCVIGYGLWRRRFGMDPNIVGRKIQVNGQLFTVIGVTPKEFTGIYQDSQLDISIPLRAAGMSAFANFPLQTFGRLKPGVSRDQAQASLDVLFRQLAAQPRSGKLSDLRIVLQPGARGLSRLRSQFAKPLLILTAVVGLVLLIACANIANLLMARAAARSKEIAVRLALGAARAVLIRQQLIESLLLATGGASIGIVLAYWVDHALPTLAPRRLGGGGAIIDINPDWRVLLFTLAVAILSSVLSGLAPAIKFTRPHLGPALKGEVGLRAPGRLSFTHVLVVLQVSLSLVLLVGAGLFLFSLSNLKAVDPGLDPDRLIVLTIDPGSAGYSLAASQRFFERLVERARNLPGVIAASPGFISPLSGDFSVIHIAVPGYQFAPGEPDAIAVNWIGTDYFKTLGTPLVAGRVFIAQDGAAKNVAIVNQRTATHFWPHENALGKHLLLGRNDDYEIVGVVKDVKSESLREAAPPAVYLPFRQNQRPHITLHVRVAGETTPVMQALTREIHTLDPNLPAVNVTTMAAQISRTLLLDRTMTMLTALFGFLAVALAAAGLYGVIAFTVAARTREIGIRMALGASRAQVFNHVMKESAALTLIGIALGVPGALWASRAVESFLYGLSATGPLIYALLACLLAFIAMAAAWVPARRAARVDPMVALRYE